MSKTAEKIANVLFGDFEQPEHIQQIDRALEGKIISKRELDALRKDAANLESAISGAKYYETEYFAAKKGAENLKAENEKLRREVQYITNLAWDAAQLATSPVLMVQRTAEEIELPPWWKFWA